MNRKKLLISIPIALIVMAFAAGNAVANVANPAQTQSHQPGQIPDIEIIDVGYGGTGCPAFPIPSATVILSPNKRSLSILFDQYVAQTFLERLVSRKSCNIAISLSIPSGYNVALVQIDYRGYADIPRGGYGRLRAEYFFAGFRGPVFVREFGSGQRDFFFRNALVEDIWSRCGVDVIARANTSIIAEKPAESVYEAYLSVDSADVEAGIIYRLSWGPC